MRILKATQITLPERARRYLHSPGQATIDAVGNLALLDEALLGLLASRECPGRALLETLDRVPEWINADRVILSGFHSPLEQQVLRSALRRHGRLVKVLARGLTDYRPLPEEREPLTTGRMLVLSACPPEVRRTTRDSAIARNRLVAALAAELCVPYVSDNSPLAEIVRHFFVKSG